MSAFGEPWEAEDWLSKGDLWDQLFRAAEPRTRIVRDNGSEEYVPVAQVDGSEDYRFGHRIVACVNALANVANPAALPELLEELANWQSCSPTLAPPDDPMDCLEDHRRRTAAALTALRATPAEGA